GDPPDAEEVPTRESVTKPARSTEDRPHPALPAVPRNELETTYDPSGRCVRPPAHDRSQYNRIATGFRLVLALATGPVNIVLARNCRWGADMAIALVRDRDDAVDRPR